MEILFGKYDIGDDGEVKEEKNTDIRGDSLL